VDSISTTAWQKHSVRSLISTLGGKYGYTIICTRREAEKARVYTIQK
jgi:hypothetical protein